MVDDLERRIISLEEWRKHMEAIMSINMAQHEKIDKRLGGISDVLESHIRDEASYQRGVYKLLITAALGAIGGLFAMIFQLLVK